MSRELYKQSGSAEVAASSKTSHNKYGYDIHYKY